MRIERFPAGLGLLAAAFLAASCGPPRLQPEKAPAVQFPLQEAVRLSCPGPLIPRIAVGPGVLILAASVAGNLQAFNPRTKTTLWTFSGGPSRTAPVVDGDRIFWAADDGRVFGLDAKGREIWTRKLDEPVRGDLRIAGGRIIFREGDKALTALNASDGAILWRDPATLPEEWTLGEDRIVARTADGRLRALHPDGRLIREISIGEPAAGGIGLAGNLVFLGFADGRFGAYDMQTGKRRWAIRLGGVPVGSPASDGKTVFVVLSNHIVAALRTKRGDILWWKPLSGRSAYPPRLVGEHLFVASRSPVLQAFFTKDGTAEIAFTAFREIVAPAEVLAQNIVLATGGEAPEEGIVFVLDLFPPKAPEKTGLTETKK